MTWADKAWINKLWGADKQPIWMSWGDTSPCAASEELYVFFWSARSTSCVKFGQSWQKFSRQTQEISMPRCPQHAELEKSARRFKTSFRLAAAEQTQALIFSSTYLSIFLAATWDNNLAEHPLQSTKCRACQRRPRDARAYIRPLCRAPSAAPATQKVAETKLTRRHQFVQRWRGPMICFLY